MTRSDFFFTITEEFVCGVISLIVYPLQPVQDPDFAEVLTDLNSRELFWLSRGQLEIAVETEGQEPQRISGFITGRKSCDSKCDSRNIRPIFPPSIFPFPVLRNTAEASDTGCRWECVFFLHLVGAPPCVALCLIFPL